jgi:uncharacterized protein YndB with AHSA1/START domain
VRERENEATGDDRDADIPPPIELDALVPCTPDNAFVYFTRDIARWWPLSRYSCSEARAATVAFEERAGGKLIETALDGTQYIWGTVLAWVPGDRIEFSWHPGKPADAALTVAVTFQRAGAMTRVRLVHSGWERLGAQAAAARESYANGWPTVLGRLFKGYCEQAAGAIVQSDPGETR